MNAIGDKAFSFADGMGIRYASISFSLLLHGMFFVQFGGKPAVMMEQATPSVTRMSFLAPSAKPQPVKEASEEKKETKKISEIKPIKKVAVEKKSDATQQESKKVEPKPEMTPAQASASTNKTQLNEGLLQKETERYLTEVMAHIEKHKWYPKAARRRGIEGEVRVSFTLLPDGSAQKIVVENAPPILLTAARKAVEKAVPMPKPPAAIHCPLPCEFRMRFSLNAT